VRVCEMKNRRHTCIYTFVCVRKRESACVRDEKEKKESKYIYTCVSVCVRERERLEA